MDAVLSGDTLLSDLQKWVSAEALKFENVEKYDLKIYGAEDKAETHGSDIAFVDISVQYFNEERREYNLVIKYRQRNKSDKEAIRYAFEREIDVYAKLVPCFHKFQESKKLPVFTFVPKCYLTKFTSTEEVLILENMKAIGYRLHDRRAPMNLNHMKLVLRAYAEFHALSFALAYQKNEEFRQITENFDSRSLENFILNEGGTLIDLSQRGLYQILNDLGEFVLLQKYKEKIDNMEASQILLKLLAEKEYQSVVLHGDCWNNNFLFKYNDEKSESQEVTNVALLDFQYSTIRSPAFDLSNFIYAVASKKELDKFGELIDHYYSHFSRYLKLLGSDPEKLFPYTNLLAHLTKYLVYGAVLNPLTMLFALVEKSKAGGFEERHRSEVLGTLVNNEEYRNRVFNVAKHFVEFKI